MKAIIFFLLFTTGLSALASSKTATGILIQAVEGTNLRAYPTLNSKIIRIAKKDEVFYRISDDSERGFVNVMTANDEEAWINEKYLYLLGDVPASIKLSKPNRKD